ncbi:MAG: hypothetical protein J0L73_14360 [Verrucomicrobia bacterium]|nr:hypothetical protein [Verrucomicrobiota bacterium]
MKLNSHDKPRSNSAIVISGSVSMFVLCYVGFRIQHSQPGLASLIGFGSFSLVFAAAGLAQLRSGYLMSNLSPGNRGGSSVQGAVAVHGFDDLLLCPRARHSGVRLMALLAGWLTR